MEPIVTPRPRLRVAVLLDSFVVPNWVRRAIAAVCDSPAAKVVLVVRNADRDPRAAWSTDRRREARRHFLYRRYTQLEERLFSGPNDPLAPDNVEDLIAGYPVLEVHPIRGGEGSIFQDSDVDRIAAYDLDVILCFGSERLRGRILKTARYGMWTCDLGGEAAQDVGAPGFWEVVDGLPVTASGLRVLAEVAAEDRVIYRSLASTDRRSVRRTLNHVCAKTGAFFSRKLVELGDQGAGRLEPMPRSDDWPRPRTRGIPGNVRMCAVLVGLAARYVADKGRELLAPAQWQVVIQRGEGRSDFIVPPKDREWADPFPVAVGDRRFVFIEEYLYAQGKGHISVIELDGRGGWQSPVPVLERDYHLSYPFIFEWRGEFFLVPETSQNETVEVYRCVSFPLEWELCKVVMQGVRVADSTLMEVSGRWWMFANLAVDGARNWDELHVFHAPSPLGPWVAHRRNPVKSDVRSARPAGRLFESGGELYRPAQDCSERYGYAVSVQRVIRLDPWEYREEEVERILPRQIPGAIGIHTLNRVGNLTVLDALVRVPRVGWR